MNHAQNCIIIRAVREHPGLTLEELAQIIYEQEPQSEIIYFLLYNNAWQLKRTLQERLLCIEERNGCFYFNHNAKRYHYFDFDDTLLRIKFKQEEQAMADQAKRKPKPSGD
ncbi:MAG: hypothetical protein PHW50_03235 [Patescibacteria group bacterium]|nr:hypothetical protein [Patescibacteria group bacterium]